MPTPRPSGVWAASPRCCGSTTSRRAWGVGAGPWGQLNEAYHSYAKGLGFHIDACLPRCPEDKGKVENKVGNLKRRLRLEGRWFESLEGLQGWTDSELTRWAQRRVCPATGDSVEASWQAEQSRLR